MKNQLLIAVLLLGLGSLSCTENKPPSNKPGENPQTAQENPQGPSFLRNRSFTPFAPQQNESEPNVVVGGGAKVDPGDFGPGARPRVNPAAAAASGGPAAPKDANWTLFCMSINTPDHMERARMLKQQLVQATGMKDFYVVSTDQQSTLFYGFYKSIERDKPEGASAHADRQKLMGLVNDAGERPLQACWFMPIEAPDPEAPAEWDLSKKALAYKFKDPARPYWSLQVGAYKDSPQRKQYAVDAVREARAQGIEAYFFHGSNVSSVCIGAWPATAIKQQIEKPFENVNPNEALLVSERPLPFKFKGDLVTDDGTPVHALAQRADIQDPALIAAIKKYPNHQINGALMLHTKRDPRTGKNVEYTDHSFLVVIPHPGFNPDAPVAHQRDNNAPPERDANAGLQLDNNGTPFENRPQPGPSPVAPAQDPSQPPRPAGGGRLRSIGGN